MNGNFHSGLSMVALKASARITADNNGAGVDVSEFQGIVQVILNSSATEAADNTSDVKLQHSADNSAWSDVTGGAFAQVVNAAASVQVLTLNADNFKKYVRVVNDLGGTTPAVTAGVMLQGIKQRS
jgi:hypothetical protein